MVSIFTVASFSQFRSMSMAIVFFPVMFDARCAEAITSAMSNAIETSDGSWHKRSNPFPVLRGTAEVAVLGLSRE